MYHSHLQEVMHDYDTKLFAELNFTLIHRIYLKLYFFLIFSHLIKHDFPISYRQRFYSWHIAQSDQYRGKTR